MIHGLDFEAPVYSLMWGRNNTCEREPAQKITLCPENYFSDRMGIFQSSVFSAQQVSKVYQNFSSFQIKTLIFLIGNLYQAPEEKFNLE